MNDEYHSDDDPSALLHLHDRSHNREAALALASSARQSIEIFSRDLEPAIYDQSPFLDALRNLATGHPKAQIRILIQDSGNVVKRGHRLVDLARRLSSFIQIRRPGEDHRGINEAFLLVDGRGYLHRQLADRFEGVACPDNPGRARNLLALFNEVWEHAGPDPDLRRLHL